MAPDPDELDRDDIVRRLFVQITIKLEDATEIAVAGQGETAHPVEQLHRVDKLRAVAEEIGLLTDAIQLIAGKPDRA